MNNKPVAWTTKKPKTVQDFSFYQTQIYTEPLYNHPVKELTEDMLWELAERHLDTDDTWGESNVTGIGDFIEAILRKVQEK